jgi:hypothetical protein
MDVQIVKLKLKGLFFVVFFFMPSPLLAEVA